jgi:hypothetical protein
MLMYLIAGAVTVLTFGAIVKKLRFAWPCSPAA